MAVKRWWCVVVCLRRDEIAAVKLYAPSVNSFAQFVMNGLSFPLLSHNRWDSHPVARLLVWQCMQGVVGSLVIALLQIS